MKAKVQRMQCTGCKQVLDNIIKDRLEMRKVVKMEEMEWGCGGGACISHTNKQKVIELIEYLKFKARVCS